MLKKPLVFASVIYAVAVFMSVGAYHPDEHFQILEFAAYKLGHTGVGNLAWEFSERMRSGFQPFLVVVLHHLWLSFGIDNPFFEVLMLRLLSACLSALVIVKIIKLYLPIVGDIGLKKTLVSLMLLGWCLPFFNVRFSSECLSASLFWLGFVAYFNEKTKSNFLNYLCVGLLFGLSFLARFQVGLMLFGFGLSILCIQKQTFKPILMLCLGFGFALFLGFLMDKWLYGEWTFSAWNYVKQNLVEGKAAQFGTEPFYYYLAVVLERAVPPFSVAMVLGVLGVVVWQPKNVLTWIIVPFLVVHSIIGHKEFRFLMPLIHVVPLCVVLSLQHIRTHKPKIDAWINRYLAWFPKVFWVANFVLLFNVFIPADVSVWLYQEIYNRAKSPKNYLFFSNQNPYIISPDFPMVVNTFYQPKNLVCLPKDSLLAMKNVDKNAVYLLDIDTLNTNKTLIVNNLEFNKIFQTIPDFVTHFDATGWSKKLNIHCLYRLENKP